MIRQSIQQSIPLVLFSLALIFAIHFKGTTYNLMYMTIASFLLISCACFGLHYHIVKKQIAIPLKLPHIVCFVWIIWLFISINWSYSPGDSWFYCWILGSLPFSFLLWGWIKPLYNQQTIFNIILVITLFYALWAIVEFIQTASSTTGPTLYQGIFGSLFAATVIPVICHYICSKPQQIVNKHFVITGVLLLALFSTFSRGAMLSYLMVLPTLFYSAYRQTIPIAKSACAILLLTFCCFIAVTQYNNYSGDQLMSNKISSETGLGSIDQRLKLYRSMLEIYKDYPVLGTGIATFKTFYRSYRDPAETSAGNFGHNDYLQYLQEGGPILLMFPLLALALIVWVLYTSNFKTRSSLQTTGFALASATIFIHAIADIILYAYVLVILAGLYLSMSYHSLLTTEKRPVKMDHPKLMVGALVMTVYLVWFGLAIDTRINTHLQGQNLWGKENKIPIVDLQTIEKYHKLSPTNPGPLVRLAEFYLIMAKDLKTEKEKIAMLETALYYTLQSLEQSPRFSEMYLKLLEIASLAPDLQTVIQQETAVYGINNNIHLKEQLLKKAIELDPKNYLASLMLANYYQQQNLNKARTVLSNALIWLNTPKMIFSKIAYLRDQQYKQKILNKSKELEDIKNKS